jgi:NADH-quinone oxidoreductase subunit L
MVAAGIYLLARIFVLLSAEALAVIAAVGALTALMAAIAALTQWDIKRVLAYSTISQLGYMVLGMGVGAYDMALFHLFTHAFFKCALFLSAGAIIHQLHHQPQPADAAKREIDPAQDLRLMGGLRQHLPWTFRFYLPPMLALSGLPLFSGFLSKDGILLGATAWAGQWGGLAWLVPAAGFLTAGLTAFYMARHALFIFGGTLRWPGAELSKLHDPDWKMSLPLGTLAVSSLWPLFSLNPFDGSQSWLARSLPTPETALPAGGPLPLAGHDSHLWVAALSVLLAVGGLLLGYRRFRRWRTAKTDPASFAWRLSSRHFFQDQLYDYLVVRPGLALGRLTAWVDQYVVDGLVRALSWATVNDSPQFSSLARWTRRFDEGLIDGLVNFVGYAAKGMGRRLRHLQSGQLQRYMMYMLLVLGAASLYGLWTWLR